ncbi:hypothetical protein E1293_46690 [Actinomadura darangshiensis]|uniref:Uncharacterized protein n=1 Tax=Actinomadura darangshiensis TaxID=705336 RepID=A0A4R4ZMR5_9ACTN|nr:hypothetical protein E1293_46690 [Actinomadura darangshiensis]
MEHDRRSGGLATTRRSLHAGAELLLAGPLYRRSGTIRLRIVPGGFTTVQAPGIRVDGTGFVAGGREIPLNGATCREPGHGGAHRGRGRRGPLQGPQWPRLRRPSRCRQPSRCRRGGRAQYRGYFARDHEALMRFGAGGVGVTRGGRVR